MMKTERSARGWIFAIIVTTAAVTASVLIMALVEPPGPKVPEPPVFVSTIRELE